MELEGLRRGREELQEEVVMPKKELQVVARAKEELQNGLVRIKKELHDAARPKEELQEEEQFEDGESDEDQVEVVMVKKKPKGDIEKKIMWKDDEIQTLLDLVNEKSDLLEGAEEAKAMLEEELQLAKLQLEEINKLSMSVIEEEVLED